MKLKCHICKKFKAETSFYRNKALPNRNLRADACKLCSKAYTHKYYKENTTKVKLINMLYKLKYKEYASEYDAQYRQAHEKSLKLYLKSYYSKNKLAYKDYRAVMNTGMAVQTYRDLLKKQNKLCAICKKPEKTRYARSKQVRHLLVNPKKSNLICHPCHDKLNK